MLKCKDIAERSSDYLDGNMSWSQKLDWHLHLFLCGPCRRFVRHFSVSVKVTAKIIDIRLSKEEAETLVQKVEASCQQAHK